MNVKKFKTEIGGRDLIVEISNLAEQANGAVTVRYKDTVILATCVMTDEPKEANFLPLSVEYEERFYAAGKIRGSRFIKREGRPSDEAILTGRLIDRSIRPRFNSRMRNEVQVIITVLSIDEENDPDVLSLVAASTALSISDIPWNGPLGAVRVGKIDQQWIINPTYEQREKSELDLVVAGTADKINMLEGESKEIPEETFLEAIKFGQKNYKKIIKFQEDIVKKIKPVKKSLEIKEIPQELVNLIKKEISAKLEETLYEKEKTTRQKNLKQVSKEWFSLVEEKYPEDEEKLKEAEFLFEDEIDKIVHKNILEKENRPDGRKLDQLREISCQVGLLPRIHGSGLFIRGTTQALSVLTLGSPGDEQLVEGMEIVGKKRFMHHYNFPPYSVGEVGPRRGPGRREIGHGLLAERALEPLLPPREEFPYTIRIVSEILSSNGSSSMASVCASSLALMDAGVPIKKAAAGIAMGLMSDSGGNYKILTDIQGPEDHHGDMDLKVAGTKDGVTVCQMDVKIEGTSLEILKKALVQAKKARLTILKEMAKAIEGPRAELSPQAPGIIIFKINPDKIGEVIGPGGKMINKIIDETGTTIDIEDDGTIFVTSEKPKDAEKAVEWIKDLTEEVKVGEIYQGKVTRTTDFGAFVEIKPKQEGLVHISELAPYRVNKVRDIVKPGDVIPVKVISIDDQGRINLSLKKAKNN